MPEVAAVLLHVQHGVLQSEIPFCGTVGVVDQHEVRVVLQTFGLQFHGAAILLTNFAKTNFSNWGPNGIQRNRFQAATTSMRHWLRVMGVTVVRLENQYLPARMTSERRLGSTKSMVVVIESASA